MKPTLLIKIAFFVWAGLVFPIDSVPAEQDIPTTMTISIVDFDLFPWYFTDDTGIMMDALKIAGKRLNVEIIFKHYPFLRAMAMLERGKTDGFAPLTFKEYRKKFGKFPTGAEGKPDESKSLLFEGYSLYKLKSSELGFDGKKFTNLTGKIGAQRGFAVIENLKALGVGDRIDSGAKGQVNNLKKVIAGRIQAAALLRTSADYLLKTNAEFGDKIERIPTPISYEGLYLILSDAFIKAYPEFSRKLWQTAEEVRNSEEFRELFRKYGAECSFCP